ncbi:hypothetical protein A3G67_00140 [Candidatus Roizmanbacteria bacterium RIFCSPLOWO2_12_FULL_40_12]|uniref:Phosphoribosyltransferase domain-containing protein n=1 Tax=Candidatus Roizmanbacteria bacterium RIFCSPLOWO2_01_FULL_40_42 TaxID=1802066 RepID=A0A1F7J5U8_9BACT|nr:MAG: hypothetical protein A2779_04890 [Candidatus Roizmanbacteria bacterium RIFCSPHIGHO2_01_FULL_40_98]OGK30144.1 MAG: hypothetical protein A2W49_01350 [Candidatus Roizmanbacteria bacterium RIFCSPHIGHO2_12_41_18]OGK50994.1 MAG: hypothetical protein A3B50_03515 [Candidatus Roizmanbacteria bacterium RIFCSPLOWO2_01_FULL_40_42]OGK58542.1 MAG: hypothetical protein A3H84_00080 [Candidatus Roizmanbacteria bacterium RIFCSPLOWO2_02_FULL_40_13]OGK60485.1 MAG: hypothetical protein A3G67_00140 [Candidat
MKFLKDLLFPRTCLNCGLLGSHICLSCQKKLKRIEKDNCFYCKRSGFLGLTHPACKKPNGVDGVLSCFYYNDVLKKILKNIKYRLTREGLTELFRLFPEETYHKLAYYKRLFPDLAVEEIPLHSARQKQRGFNQSGDIAAFLTMSFGFPRAQNLKRIKNTFPQSQQTKHRKRKDNIRNAFILSKEKLIPVRHIVLVDDVITTGATVAEAARVLKKHGALKVFVFTLAKG